MFYIPSSAGARTWWTIGVYYLIIYDDDDYSAYVESYHVLVYLYVCLVAYRTLHVQGSVSCQTNI